MKPLFPSGFLPLPKVQGFSTYTSSPVPSSSLSPGPAPLVMPSLPPMPNGMTASASAPMEPQARQQHGGLGWGEVWDLGWFWEAKVGVTEMEWNLCFWSFFINMLGWTFCEIEDMDNGGEEATFQMVHQMRGGFQDWLFVLYASRFDKSVLPQGSTIPKHLSLIQKGSPIHYLQRLDQTKLRHDASVPSIYLTGWNKARCKIFRAFLVTLASASGISRSQVRGLCLASTGGCILSSTGADDADGSESRDTDAGGESIATQRSGAKRSWDYGMWSAWKKLEIFLHAFSLLDFIKQLLGVGAGNSMVCIGVWKCSNCSRPVADVFYSAMLVNLKLYLIFGSARSERCTDTHRKSQKRCLEKAMVKNLPYQFWSTFCLWLFSVF